MKLSKKAASSTSCLLVLIYCTQLVLQIILLTLKLSGVLDWSWWEILVPTFAMLSLPLALIVTAVLVLLPKAVVENIHRRKRLEAEAKKYGMERKPGESDAELRKRIIRRNMLIGKYSRKDVKDEILKAFPNVGSCQILTNNQTDVIVLILRRAATENGAESFTDDELQEITEFAAKYIPDTYKITAKKRITQGG